MKIAKKLLFLTLFIPVFSQTLAQDLASKLGQLEISLNYLLAMLPEDFSKTEQEVIDLIDPLLQALQNELDTLFGVPAPQNPVNYYNANLKSSVDDIINTFNGLSAEKQNIFKQKYIDFIAANSKILNDIIVAQELKQEFRSAISVISRFKIPAFKALVSTSTTIAPELKQVSDDLTKQHIEFFKQYLGNVDWAANPFLLVDENSVNNALGDIYHYEKISGDLDSYQNAKNILEAREKTLKFVDYMKTRLEKLSTVDKIADNVDNIFLDIPANSIFVPLRRDPSTPVAISSNELPKEEQIILLGLILPDLCKKITNAKPLEENNYYAQLIQYIYKNFIEKLPQDQWKAEVLQAINTCVEKIKLGLSLIFDNTTLYLNRFSIDAPDYNHNTLLQSLNEIKKLLPLLESDHQKKIVDYITQFDKSTIEIDLQLDDDFASLREIEKELVAALLLQRINQLKEIRAIYKDLIEQNKFDQNEKTLGTLEAEIKKLPLPPLSLVNLYRAYIEINKLIDRNSVANFIAKYDFATFLAPKLKEVKDAYANMEQDEQKQLREQGTKFFELVANALLEYAEQDYDAADSEEEKTIKFVAITELLKNLIEQSSPELIQPGEARYVSVIKKLDGIIENLQSKVLRNIEQIEKDIAVYTSAINDINMNLANPAISTLKMINDHDNALDLANNALDFMEQTIKLPALATVDKYQKVNTTLKNFANILLKTLADNPGLFNRYTNRLNEKLIDIEQEYKNAQNIYLSPISFEYPKDNKISKNEAYNIFGLAPGTTKANILKAFAKKTAGMDQSSADFSSLNYLKSSLIAEVAKETDWQNVQKTYFNAQKANATTKNELKNLQAKYQKFVGQLNKIVNMLGI